LSQSFPIRERYFHLSLLVAPFVDEQRRRAMLETALELLSDEGHRHVLRSTLATEAARAGDLRAAEDWLQAVNPKSVDLVMHTSYCLAAATLARSRGDYNGVTAVLGTHEGDVPLGNRDEIACTLLRIDALDHLQCQDQAMAELKALIEKWGAERLKFSIDHHHPLPICERLFPIAAATVELTRQRGKTAGFVHQLEGLDKRLELKSTIVALALTTTLITLFLTGLSWAFGILDLLQLDQFFGRSFGVFDMVLLIAFIVLFFLVISVIRGRRERIPRRAELQAKVDEAQSREAELMRVIG